MLTNLDGLHSRNKRKTSCTIKHKDTQHKKKKVSAQVKTETKNKPKRARK